jgi:hypothetical protein
MKLLVCPIHLKTLFLLLICMCQPSCCRTKIFLPHHDFMVEMLQTKLGRKLINLFTVHNVGVFGKVHLCIFIFGLVMNG